MSEKPILGILLGNSAGVGPELVAMLAVKDYYADYCRPVIIGDLRMFEHGLKVVGGDVPHYVIDDLSQCDWSKGYPVLDLKDQDPDQVVYGEANAYCGAGDLKQLDTAIELCKAGKIDFKVDKFGIVHSSVGKIAFSAEQIADNASEFMNTILKLKPTTAKGTYVKSIFLSTTMSPVLQIDPKSVETK